MSHYHPGPWWAKESPYGSTLILDIHGRKLAEVFHDADRPDMSRGTVALFQHAPSLYRTLRFVTDLLRVQGGRDELVEHLEKTLRLVEPEAVAQQEPPCEVTAFQPSLIAAWLEPATEEPIPDTTR